MGHRAHPASAYTASAHGPLQDILTDLSAESESLHLDTDLQDCVAHKVLGVAGLVSCT